MGESRKVDTHYLDCPFCFGPINAAKIQQPEHWACPVCNTPDSEWNFMLSCANCGYSHRIFECPHCQEDFDTMRAMYDYNPLYLDYLRVGKCDGPQAKYRLGDLNIVFLQKLDEELKRNLLDLFSEVSFSFPGYPGQIRIVQIYGMEEDKSIKNKLWFSAYLYDRDEAKLNTDIGQLVLCFTNEEGMQLHSVVDVSRNFIAANEKQKEKLSQPGIIDKSESLCIKKIHKLSDFLQAHELQAQHKISEANCLANECLQSCLGVLSDAFDSNKEPSKQFWNMLNELGEGVVQLNLTDKNMPWHGTELNDVQKNSLKILNRYIASAYYNSGVALNKSEEDIPARQRYKMAVKFSPEPELAVPLHHNWARSIDSELYDTMPIGQEESMDKAWGHLAHYCEMIAHCDEVVRQYPLLADDDKDCYRTLYEKSKERVQSALNTEKRLIRRSKGDSSQLVFVSPEDGRELTPLKTTWTEYDLTDVQQDISMIEALSRDIKEPSAAASHYTAPELAEDNEATEEIVGNPSKGATKTLIGLSAAVIMLIIGVIVTQNCLTDDMKSEKIQTQASPAKVSIQKNGYTSTRVNFRTGPGAENPTIGILEKNTIAFLISSKSDRNGVEWYQLEIADGPLKGKTGYLHTKYFEVKKQVH